MGANTVSILIIMAVTLKEELELREFDQSQCFNPYYNGSDSKRKKMVFYWWTWSGVSILIIMAVTLKV